MIDFEKHEKENAKQVLGDPKRKRDAKLGLGDPRGKRCQAGAWRSKGRERLTEKNIVWSAKPQLGIDVLRNHKKAKKNIVWSAKPQLGIDVLRNHTNQEEHRLER